MITKTILSLLLVAVFTPVALADCPDGQCLSCYDFCTHASGYTNSPFMGNCNGTPKDCRIVAQIAPHSYIDSLHPGFFTLMGREGLIVKGVIPNSPADLEGIVGGDQILLLNGKDPIGLCSIREWPSKEGSHSADIVLSHEGIIRNVRLELVPVRQLLSQGWLASGSRVAAASLRESSAPREGSFALGLKWESSVGSLEITDVLWASTAFRNDLAPGDKIIRVNGTDVKHLDPESLKFALGEHVGTRVRLTVVRGRSEREVNLSAEGASQLLHKLPTADPAKPGRPDLAAELFR